MRYLPSNHLCTFGEACLRSAPLATNGSIAGGSVFVLLTRPPRQSPVGAYRPPAVAGDVAPAVDFHGQSICRVVLFSNEAAPAERTRVRHDEFLFRCQAAARAFFIRGQVILRPREAALDASVWQRQSWAHDAEVVVQAMKELQNYNRAVVVSGDGDFYCLVEYLQQEKKLLHLLAPNSHYSTLYRPYEDRIVVLDAFKKELSYGSVRRTRSNKKSTAKPKSKAK